MDQGAQINQIEYITCIANLIPETIKIVDNVKILSFVNFFNYVCHFSFFVLIGIMLRIGKTCWIPFEPEVVHTSYVYHVA